MKSTEEFFVFLEVNEMSTDDDGVPSEVAAKLLRIDEATREMLKHFKDHAHVPRSQQLETGDPLMKAKVNLVYLFAMHSSFWVYLKLRGVDPKSHAVKDDLGKIQQMMARVTDIEKRRKMARLNVPAAGRFIKSGLQWSQKRKSEGIKEEPEAKIKKEV